MDFFIGKELLDDDSIVSVEISEKIHILLFAVIDAIIIVILSMNLRPKDQKLILLKHKILTIFIIDVIIRIINLRKYGNFVVYKEILTTVLQASQFYLIISFLQEITYNIKTSKQSKTNGLICRIKLCLLFLILSYSYEKLNFPKKWDDFFYLPLYKMIILIESFMILDVILLNYTYFFQLIWFISNMIMNESKVYQNNTIIKFLNGSPFSCLILFILYYALRVAFLFNTNPRYIIYSNVILIVIRYTIEYFVFFTCNIIAYLLNDINNKGKRENNKQIYTVFDENENLNVLKNLKNIQK